MWAGLPELALERFAAARNLAPRGRFGLASSHAGAAYFFLRRFDEAAANLLLGIRDEPEFTTGYRLLAPCYGHMGRLENARAMIARLKTLTPVVLPDLSRYRNPEHRELLLSGLRLAMGGTS